MELYDVVRKLVGPIEPVGETRADGVRYENLKMQLDLMEQLHGEVSRIAGETTGRAEFSMIRAGKLCDSYLEWLREED